MYQAKILYVDVRGLFFLRYFTTSYYTRVKQL